MDPARGGRAARFLALVAALVALSFHARTPARSQPPDAARVHQSDELSWIGANDLARLLAATKFWRHDVRKLVLRTGEHRLQFTADNPFVLIDDRTVLLPADVRSERGELQIPVAVLDLLPRDSTVARLFHDRGRGVVLRVPAAGLVGTPKMAIEGASTSLVFQAEHSEDVAVRSRSRAHFQLHFAGVFVGALPDSLPLESLVESIRTVPAASGTTLELSIAAAARGFRITRELEERRVTLTLTGEARADHESFAPEGPPGARRVRVVALDPGHGGSDAGVTVEGAVEKELTLTLARLLRAEITRRLAARVVLVRETDEALSMDERAERANRAHADLVLSLHFDGLPGATARGVTAYCPPATYGSETRVPGGRTALVLLPWRDAATRHAVVSREVAERILAAIDLRVPGPSRLREVLPYTLLGVNAPALMLECATLTSPADRARVTSAQGLTELATAIVDGLEAFQATP
jgi:N-acetylmuramoyl-L-alanine amidase